MPFDQSRFNAQMDRKYDIMAEEAAAKTLTSKGEYARNIADAQSLPGYREALGFHARGVGQQALESAATESARRYMDPDWLRGAFRSMYETGQLPGYTNQPGAGAPGVGAVARGGAPAPSVGAPGAVAPGAGVGGAGASAAPPPIQFQTLPDQSGAPAARPAASRTAADAAETPDTMTSPESVADMTPEQLSSWSQSQATRGAQGATAGAGAAPGRAAQQRLAEAQARMPSFQRPTPVTTTSVSATKPLYTPGFGFRRGIANVPGYAAGDEDVLLRRPLLYGQPAGAGRGAVGSAPGSLAGLPPGGPAPTQPGPSPGPYDPGPGPGPGGGGGGGSFSPAGVPQIENTSTWPSGAPRGFNYDPNAGTGLENIGGVMDSITRTINPERFSQAVEGFPVSQNVEDRRGQGPPTALGTVANVASDIGGRIAQGGQMLASDIWRTIAGDQPAAPGSLAQQAGYNDISGGTSSGLVGSLGSIFGGASTAPAAPAAPAAGATAPSSDTGEDAGYRKGTANVKGKAGKAGGSPKGLEALLPILAAMQGGGGGGPPAGPPTGAGPPPGAGPGLKKGSANVKGKGGKAGKAGGPKGLEALLPALMAAMQGGGAGGPAAGPPPGGAPPGAGPGLKKGSTNVKGKGSKGGSKPPPTDQPPTGIEAMLPALMAAAKGGGAAGPQAASGLPPAMGPGAAAPPGFAQGAASVQPMPNYPFGAGYLFGANEVPGQGSGQTDTVPAMLAPHEAVLNKAAADILGRGLIAALNTQGVKQMGMGRGR